MSTFKWQEPLPNQYILKMGNYNLLVNTTNNVTFWWCIQLQDEVVTSAYSKKNLPKTLQEAQQQCLNKYYEIAELTH